MKKWVTFLLFIVVVISACDNRTKITTSETSQHWPDDPYVIVLGIAQDAGFPQADCQKDCCKEAWTDFSKRRMVSCIGIVDPYTNQCWMIDATPDFKDQLYFLQNHRGRRLNLEGIALTHAHIGHYTGLMHLGREVMGSSEVSVLAMPKMKSFLSENGPWSQLVDLQNIIISELKHDSIYVLNENLHLRPFIVPHRDEFSETVGYEVSTKNKSLFFIPDIDKWSKWDQDLVNEVQNHDYALIDGSFYANGEIPGRDMSEIPHPFVTETMTMLKDLGDTEKEKVHFIHLNHTNPILNPQSTQYKQVLSNGFGVCRQEAVFRL